VKRLVLFLVALSTATPLALAQESVSAEQFQEWFRQVANHGRWGADDELGTLNTITPERSREATASVRAGISISLSRDLIPGEDVNALAPLEVDYTGEANGGLISFFGDRTDLVYHGWAYSHLDALAHVASHGKLYNGYPETLAARDDGPEKLGVENMRNGIVTRGVLIDVPWLKSVPYLEPSEAVTLMDIKAWEKRTGVRIGEGDVVLIRTGRGAREAELGPWDVRKQGTAGPHPEIATLLHERGVAMLGGDVANEIYPSVVADNPGPMHLLALASMGMPLFDNLGLETLAREAQTQERFTFLFVVAPLPIEHATGSAVNPLAIF